MQLSGQIPPCDRSEAFWMKAQELIPDGTQTMSKGPQQFVFGVFPIYLERGKGSHVWDVDGNEYIDYSQALGPIILGHAYPAVTEAVRHQLEQGTTFTLLHPLEVEVAELLTEIVPSAEMVRFAKNGSDVTAAAVRLVRAYTRREHIAYCGYHGWEDWYVAGTTRNIGVPACLRDLLHPFEYDHIETLEQVFAEHPDDIAAVIMEPVITVPPRNGFLEQVKELAHAHGALLIFDGVVSGFRYALGGAQVLYGVTPDLTCLGKAWPTDCHCQLW